MKVDDELKQKLVRVLDRVEALLPETPPVVDWSVVKAARWETGRMGGHLAPMDVTMDIGLDDLLFIDDQKELVDANTRQFVAGEPANNVLLWGSRGTGKSSLVRALLNAYHDRGLRMVEVDKSDLRYLPGIAAHLEDAAHRFIMFCDDLSFEEGDAEYKALKSALDGSLNRTRNNVIVYATSNRRHLMPEYSSENLDARLVDGELHYGEAVEEKLSLSDRFGIWVSFYPFDQDQYLAMVGHWLKRISGCRNMVVDAQCRRSALQWALEKANRSGRTAYQFAAHWVGSHRV